MRQLFQAGQLFQGVVSNCKQRVLSTTSGKIYTTAFTRSVEGSIGTTHSHYTTFDIGNMGFKLKGDYPLRDGDEVVCYAIKIGGHYLVETLKNFTRNYFIRDKLAPMWAYLIWGILLACGAFWLLSQVMTFVRADSITAIGAFLFGAFFGVTSLKCFIKMPMANYKDKQNKIIENYNPRLTQADNIALTQAQLANESKKKCSKAFFIFNGLAELAFLGFGRRFDDCYVSCCECNNKRSMGKEYFALASR